MMPAARRWLIVAAVLLAAAAIAFLAYDRYRERYTVTAPEAGGAPITTLISARMAGASALKVASLSGTIQSTASDVRGFGWLRSDQVVKMPYSVDYFVDVARIGSSDIEWSDATRTLIVNAPDVVPARANIDEAQRSLVKTTGIFVTRKAAEDLSQRTSIHATAKANQAAASPARMAQARELARQAMVKLYANPLRALGHADARVIVTFPYERRRINGEQWDVSRSVEDVVNNRF
ncbi:MAG: DUF4230 domain-containing protein [Sphingomonas sp.]|nr:DUF4230 domain-containing protein [Sphingomonas sp.]